MLKTVAGPSGVLTAGSVADIDDGMALLWMSANACIEVLDKKKAPELFECAVAPQVEHNAHTYEPKGRRKGRRQ